MTFEEITDWLYGKIFYVLGYIAGFFSALAYKVYSLLQDGWNYIVNIYTDILDGVYAAIGFNSVFQYFGFLNGTGIGYFYEYFGGNELLTVTISAYLIRFGVRRIPVIG